MKYNLLKEVILLLETFEEDNQNGNYSSNRDGFCQWIIDTKAETLPYDLDWEGKANGRSIESVISTLIVHMNKYAKNYSKSAINDSLFSTQDEFIYLITLNSFGEMTKIDLIRHNKMDKPTGIQIINRLIKLGWIRQIDSSKDKRSKILQITDSGKNYLNFKMDDIRKASKIVTADLTDNEKLELARILTKMDKFHQKIYFKNLNTNQLLQEAYESYTIVHNQK